MKLQGTRCALRPWRLDDAESLVRHANNINVARQLRDRFPNPYSRANASAFLKAATSAPEPSNLAIEVDSQAIGAIGYVSGIDVERYSAEIGYWLGEAYWGKGIATEALMLMTGHVFEVMNMLRLYSHAMTVYQTTDRARVANDPFVIADELHYVHRLHRDHARSVLALDDPNEARAIEGRFQEILDASSPAVFATTLGL